MVFTDILLVLLLGCLAVEELHVAAASSLNCTASTDDETKGSNSTSNQTSCEVSSPENSTPSSKEESPTVESKFEDITTDAEPSSSERNIDMSTTPIIPESTASILNDTTDSEGYGSGFTTYPQTTLNTGWITTFINLHHFSGHYVYNGMIFRTTFIVRYVHPYSSETLVANFHDDTGGAILQMNGTSADNRRIIFRTAKMFAVGERFPLDQDFELDGVFPTYGNAYIGNITCPKNSNFTTFYLQSGIGDIEMESRRMSFALVIFIPVMCAGVLVAITAGVIFWAYKKGMLGRGRHKTYRLFKNNSVKYEAEAETIHI